MIDSLFTYIEAVDGSLWSYVCFPLIMILGVYFSITSRFFQIRYFPKVVRTFIDFLRVRSTDAHGVHPLKAFFACIGGCVGIGNVVAICTAVQIGGPGALFWIWMTAIAGMTLKYAEVFLGMRYRVTDAKGHYVGGPMYFLRQVFSTPTIPALVAFLLCVYGIEVYQFNIITTSISSNFSVSPFLVAVALLGLVFYAVNGGVNRVGQISSTIVPLFMVLYMGMGLWVILQNITVFPAVIVNVFKSAFTGHAAMGAFVGAALMQTISQGIKRGCYASDVGIGYASVIHSESNEQIPQKQALLTIFEIFLDAFFICTTSVVIILVTDVWQMPLHESMLVQTALGMYFPYMNVFMPVFLFLLGYSTIIAFFCVGIRSAEYLLPAHGKKIYFLYGLPCLFAFSFLDTTEAMVIMSLTQALLLMINLYGIFKLRKEISFECDWKTEPVAESIEAVIEKA
jgi:AGCS family alanine or glycine:cation symporter